MAVNNTTHITRYKGRKKLERGTLDDVSVVRIQIAHLLLLFPGEMGTFIASTVTVAVLVSDE